MNKNLKVFLFDHLEVLGEDGQPIEHPRFKGNAVKLLKVLLTDRGVSFTTGQLQEMIAPGESLNLDHPILYLRRSLEPDLKSGPKSRYIKRTGVRTYAFDGDIDVWIDTEVFEGYVKTGKRFIELENWNAVFNEFQSALELYRGPYLVEDRYEDWSLEPRNRYKDLYVDALLGIANVYYRQRSYEFSIDYCEKAIQKDKIREDAFYFKMLGLSGLNEIDEALNAYQTYKENLEFEPSGKIKLLYERLLEGDLPPPPERETPHNIPKSLDEFVGRHFEKSDLEALLKESRRRLITLKGSGGTGKTRLSKEFSKQEHILEAFFDGVWFIELASLSKPEFIIQAIAHALEISEKPGQPLLEAVCENLKEKKTLIILDNCEQFVEPCREIVKTILERCKDVRILATSRIPLGVKAEFIYELKTLSLPELNSDSLEQYRDSEAFHLFEERLDNSNFINQISLTDAKIIAQICHLLEGHPLSIELVAAQFSLKSAEIALNQLEKSLNQLLEIDIPDGFHKSLLASAKWSYNFLDKAEKSLFRKLSVFNGNFDMFAAQYITSTEFSYWNPLDQLVKKSILQEEKDFEGNLQFSMLNVIRIFSASLNSEDENLELQSKHLDYYKQQAQEAQPHLRVSDPTSWLNRLELNKDNFRTALQFALDQENLEALATLTSALHDFWTVRGLWAEARQWNETALPLITDKKHISKRAQLLYQCGYFSQIQGDYEAALKRHEEGLKLFIQLKNKPGQAHALTSLGVTRMFQRKLPDSLVFYNKALAFYETLKEIRGIGEVKANLGILGYMEGNIEKAYQHFTEAKACFEEVDDRINLSKVNQNLGSIHWSLGKYQTSLTLYESALELYQSLGNENGQGESKANIGRALEAIKVEGHPEFTDQPCFAEPNLNKILNYHQEALVIFKKQDNLMRHIDSLQKMGSAQLNGGKPDDALKNFQTALDLCADIPQLIHLKIAALSNIGRAYYFKDKLEKAVLFSTQSVDFLEEHRLPEEESITFVHALILQTQGDKKNAKEYFKQSRDAVQSKVDRISDKSLKKQFLNAYQQLLLRSKT